MRARWNRTSRWLLGCGIASLVLVASAVTSRAYSTFGSWGSSSPLMFINPQNADVSASAAESAVLAAMDIWNNAGTGFRFSYGGRTSEDSFGQDGKSVVIFRNESSGGALGSTYAWSWNGVLTEADVVFWDGGFQFFTGSTGCVGGMYIEDVAAHELGHAAGLGHSENSDATMYYSASSYCSQDWRSLTSDDVTGLKAIYGGSSAPSPPREANNPPAVTVTSPVSGSSFGSGASVYFSGSATDLEDGDLTSRLTWRSNIDGALPSGSGFSRVLSAGTHTVTASVTDAGGSTVSASTVVTVAAAASGGPVLSTTTNRRKGVQSVNLSWSGLSGSSVTVFRNGTLIVTTANDGKHTDSIGSKGAGSYTYRMCETASSTCTNDARVTF